MSKKQNARKGIKTRLDRSPACDACAWSKKQNARKGIKTYHASISLSQHTNKSQKNKMPGRALRPVWLKAVGIDMYANGQKNKMPGRALRLVGSYYCMKNRVLSKKQNARKGIKTQPQSQ